MIDGRPQTKQKPLFRWKNDENVVLNSVLSPNQSIKWLKRMQVCCIIFISFFTDDENLIIIMIIIHKTKFDNDNNQKTYYDDDDDNKKKVVWFDSIQKKFFQSFDCVVDFFLLLLFDSFGKKYNPLLNIVIIWSVFFRFSQCLFYVFLSFACVVMLLFFFLLQNRIKNFFLCCCCCWIIRLHWPMSDVIDVYVCIYGREDYYSNGSFTHHHYIIRDGEKW